MANAIEELNVPLLPEIKTLTEEEFTNLGSMGMGLRNIEQYSLRDELSNGTSGDMVVVTNTKDIKNAEEYSEAIKKRIRTVVNDYVYGEFFFRNDQMSKCFSEPFIARLPVFLLVQSSNLIDSYPYDSGNTSYSPFGKIGTGRLVTKSTDIFWHLNVDDIKKVINEMRSNYMGYFENTIAEKIVNNEDLLSYFLNDLTIRITNLVIKEIKGKINFKENLPLV